MSPRPKATLATHALPLLALAVAMAWMYASVVRTPYGVIDDYHNLWGGLTDYSWPLQKHTSEGRLITAWTRLVQYRWADGIPDLRLIRSFGLLGYTFAACCVYFFSWRHLWFRLAATRSRCWASAASAAGIMSLPCFQSVISTTDSASFFLAIPLALLASALASKVADSGATRARRFHLVIVSIVSFFAALSCYQPMSMWYWVFSGLRLMDDRRSVRQRLTEFGVAFGLGTVAMLLGFLTVRALAPPEIDRSTLTTDVIGKLVWFVREPLNSALNLAFMVPSGGFATAMAVWIVGGTAAYLRDDPRDRLLVLAGVTLSVILSYAPNLVISESWAAYRSQVALGSMLYLLAMLALQGWIGLISRARPAPPWTPAACAMAIGLTCVILCAGNVRRTVTHPQMLELSFLRSELQLAETRIEAKRALTLIRPTANHSPCSIHRYDEFCNPSSMHPWNTEPMARLVLRELGIDDTRIRIDVKPPDTQRSGISPPVVDMRELRGLR